VITPVPWTKNKIGAHVEFIDVEPGVCTVWNTYDNAEENADLIIAAPHLKEAAEFALSVLRENCPVFEESEMAIKKLEAALALVQGERSEK